MALREGKRASHDRNRLILQSVRLHLGLQFSLDLIHTNAQRQVLIRLSIKHVFVFKVLTQSQITLTVFDAHSRGTPANIRVAYSLIFLETKIIGIHGWLRIFFCKSDVSAVRGHPMSLILVPIERA